MFFSKRAFNPLSSSSRCFGDNFDFDILIFVDLAVEAADDFESS
jgi:hypothetical protein